MDELIAICEALAIDPEELSKQFSIWRFETLHVRGVDQLTSKDIFNYFGPIHPHSIEWLSNISCNATFDNSAKACNALLSVANALIIHKNQNPDSIGDTVNISVDLEVQSSDSLEIPVPPNYRYILGCENEKAKSIIIRFATINDKKTIPSNTIKLPTLPDDVISHSNVQDVDMEMNDDTNFEEPTPHLNRSFNSSRIKFKNSNIRMRMRADEEEQNIQYKQNSRDNRSLSSRLGGSFSRSDGNWFRSSVPSRNSNIANRVGSRISPNLITKNKNNIWRRVGNSSRNIDIPLGVKDLRQKLASRDAIVRVRVSYDD